MNASTIDTRQVRIGLGMGIEKFARAMGVGISSIRRWERRDSEPTGPASFVYRALQEAQSNSAEARGDLIVAARESPYAFVSTAFALSRQQDGFVSAVNDIMLELTMADRWYGCVQPEWRLWLNYRHLTPEEVASLALDGHDGNAW